MSLFNYQIVAIQNWNNDKRVILTKHRSLISAEKQLRVNNKRAKRMCNTYLIEEIGL